MADDPDTTTGPERLADIFARLGVKPRPIDPKDYQEIVNATRAATWKRACLLGSCRYATEDVTQKNPPSVDSTKVCGGYLGVYHKADEQNEKPIWRWRPCDRHLRWAKKRGEYAKTEFGTPMKEPPSKKNRFGTD